MKHFTKKETKLLLKKEDVLTLEQFATLFKCTPKEVYAYYDHITSTKEYKDFARARTLMFYKKYRRKDNEEVPSTYEDTEDRAKVNDLFAKLCPSDNIVDRLTDNYM